jgi:hypothetical protein
MLYSMYRELGLPEEAERYWKVKPQTGIEASGVQGQFSSNASTSSMLHDAPNEGNLRNFSDV